MTATKLKASTGPLSEPLAAPSLSKTVRERLEQFAEADPSGLVEILLEDLDDDMYYEAARRGLGLVVDQLISQQRRSNRRTPGRSGKWDNATEVEREHRDVFEFRIFAGSGWKFLGDCNKRDLRFAEQDRRQKGEGLLVEAERFRNLATKLRGQKVVRDLDRGLVEGILHA